MRARKVYYPRDEDIDWKVEALRELETDIVGKANSYFIHGMTSDDIAQELRIKLWDALLKFDPELSSIRTWSNRVMRNALINMHISQNAFKRRIDLLPEDWDVYITTIDD